MNYREVFFSIIIATYNRARTISRTIESILSQKFSDFEIIIVNDGGTDNTEEIVKSFDDNRIQFHFIVNSERGAARNYGMKHAKGRYINFFDSDDLFLPCFEELHNFIIKNNDPEVVYGAIRHVNSNYQEIHVPQPPYSSFTKNLFHNNFLACGSVFLKRNIALHFNFVEDRRLSSAEDWELWLRIHAKYPFTSFPYHIFQQVHHHERSLNKINADTVEIRDTYFLEIVQNNDDLSNRFGRQTLNLFVADRFTFIALSWSNYNRSKTYFYLKKALKTSLSVTTRKRFWAVLKKILLG